MWVGIANAFERAVTFILQFDLPWTIWRLFPASLRLRCYRRFQSHSLRDLFSSTTILPFGLIVKAKAHDPYAEAEVTRFVAKNTNIPTPKILDVVTYMDGSEQRGLILMNKQSLGGWVNKRIRRVPAAIALIAQLDTNDMGSIPGIVAELLKLPRPTADMADGAQLVSDLCNAVNQLRALTPLSQAVSGLNSGPLLVGRAGEKTLMGPLRRISYLFKYRLPGLRRLAEPVLAKTHRICFTHADLHGHNIIVKDGRLAAIIDCEHAGWYPEYWELTTMEQVMMHMYEMNTFWDQVQLFGEDPYRDELTFEWALWRSTALVSSASMVTILNVLGMCVRVFCCMYSDPHCHS